MGFPGGLVVENPPAKKINPENSLEGLMLKVFQDKEAAIITSTQ